MEIILHEENWNLYKISRFHGILKESLKISYDNFESFFFSLDNLELSFLKEINIYDVQLLASKIEISQRFHDILKKILNSYDFESSFFFLII